MPQEHQIQTRLQDLLKKGRELVREGVADAEYLLGMTVNATRLHMTMRRDIIAKHRVLHELGRELWKAIPADPDVREIRITETMREKVRRIEALEAEIQQAEREASLVSVVRKDDSLQRGSSKKSSAAR